jgi:hypothetical protein
MSLKNVETFVFLDWFITDFDSKYQRYRLTGDGFLIGQIIKVAAQGRTILAKMKKPIQEISKNLMLDLSIESVRTQAFPPSGPWHDVYFLSFGKKVDQLKDTYATQFVIKSLNQEMGIKSPALRFKLFYLPPLPTATSDEGHFMETVEGFTSVKRKLIEINLYPPLNYDKIFKTMAHEILHVCFLNESSLDHVQEVEAKVDENERVFVAKCQEEYLSQKNRINQSIKSVIDKELPVLLKADEALNKSRKELQEASVVVNTFREFFDAVRDERVKPVCIE